MMTSLKPLADGLYTIVYRVTSLDGHPVQSESHSPWEQRQTCKPPAAVVEGSGPLTAVAGAVLGGVQALAVVLTEVAVYALRTSGEGLFLNLLAHAIVKTHTGQLWKHDAGNHRDQNRWKS